MGKQRSNMRAFTTLYSHRSINSGAGNPALPGSVSLGCRVPPDARNFEPLDDFRSSFRIGEALWMAAIPVLAGKDRNRHNRGLPETARSKTRA